MAAIGGADLDRTGGGPKTEGLEYLGEKMSKCRSAIRRADGEAPEKSGILIGLLVSKRGEKHNG